MMTGLLPDDIAIIVLGPGGAALGRRLRTALPGARLHGPRAEPFTMQLRLGEYDGEWRVWEATNLTGRRGAWTR